MKKTTIYLHTRNEKPAYFDGKEIVELRNTTSISKFPTSLLEVKEEQKKSFEFREYYNMPFEKTDYSYKRLTI